LPFSFFPERKTLLKQLSFESRQRSDRIFAEAEALATSFLARLQLRADRATSDSLSVANQPPASPPGSSAAPRPHEPSHVPRYGALQALRKELLQLF
jgi:hypothetical protein